LATDIAWTVWARRRLLTEFRIAAAERFRRPDKGGGFGWLTGRLAWKSDSVGVSTLKTGIRSAGLLLLCLVGCSQPPQIVVTVPDGFRGLVRIHESRTNGVALGTFTKTTLPTSGDLAFNGGNPLDTPHSWSLAYQDGQPIPFLKPDSVIANEAIAFRQVGRGTNGEVWFVVGTHTEAAEAQARLGSAIAGNNNGERK
jgi:hypothetical protein